MKMFFTNVIKFYLSNKFSLKLFMFILSKATSSVEKKFENFPSAWLLTQMSLLMLKNDPINEILLVENIRVC